MLVAGIDPGAKGCICLLDDNDKVTFLDYSKYGIIMWSQWLKEHTPEFVLVEDVHAMPGQGVVSMFSFGQRLGEIVGILTTLSIRYELVSPKTWRKAIGVKPNDTKHDVADKMKSLYLGVDLYGSRGGLLDGRSDSLALAHYAKQWYLSQHVNNPRRKGKGSKTNE